MTRPGPLERFGAAARVLGALWRVNVVEELQYRANFVASLLGTLFWMAMALLTLALFFRHTTRLGGWDYWEVVALLGVFNALTGVIEAVLRPGIGELADEVRSGRLDLILVRPWRSDSGSRPTPSGGWDGRPRPRACSRLSSPSAPRSRSCMLSGWRS
jgi:hypothetical protein